MPKRKLPKYLSLNYNTYVVTLDIPKDVRPKFAGKPRFYKSLQTDSLSEAEARKWKHIDKWKNLIKAARNGQSYLDEMRVHLTAAKGEEDKLLTEEALRDVATDIASETGDRSAIEAFSVATGEWIKLGEHLARWEHETRPHITPKTFDMQLSDIERLLSRFTYLHEVTPEEARRHLDTFEVSANTKKRILSAWRSFLSVIGHKNLLRDVTFELDARRNRKKKSHKRQPLSDEQIKQLLETSDGQLRDLILLGAYTGARIEELCSLELPDVTERAFRITEAKSLAGVRDIPIHSKLQQLVERLKQSSRDGYLLSGLSKRNKYGRRSEGIGKRFGRLKERLGFDERYVFHSLRKSFITKLENAGVQENLAARIAGHEIGKSNMSYGLYSGGPTFETLKEIVELVEYEL